MRTMIQPSHRTFAHLNLFSFYRSGKTKTKSREKKIRAQRAILVHVMHTTNATRTAKKAKKKQHTEGVLLLLLLLRSVPLWSVLEAIAHSPWYHTHGRSCCTATRRSPQRVSHSVCTFRVVSTGVTCILRTPTVITMFSELHSSVLSSLLLSRRRQQQQHRTAAHCSSCSSANMNTSENGPHHHGRPSWDQALGPGPIYM